MDAHRFACRRRRLAGRRADGRLRAILPGDHDRTPILETIVGLYRSLSMAAVVFTVDAGTFTGHPPLAVVADRVARRVGAVPYRRNSILSRGKPPFT
jgi:hypothetical protein